MIHFQFSFLEGRLIFPALSCFQEVFDEGQLPCSPPNSSVRMSECQENTTDVLGKSSPVSVLEPLFTDDDTSPNSSRFSSGMLRKNLQHQFSILVKILFKTQSLTFFIASFSRNADATTVHKIRRT